MSDVITRTLLTVAGIWALAAAAAFALDLKDLIRGRLAARRRWTDPWNCPVTCGQEYGYWCHHLAAEARCSAVNEHGQQCTECAGHDTDATTWPGFAIGHSYNPAVDRSL